MQPLVIEEHVLVEIFKATRSNQMKWQLTEFPQIIACDDTLLIGESQRLNGNLPIS